MDRTELLLSLIVFLLAALTFVSADNNTPSLLLLVVFLILLVFPFYVGIAFFLENVTGS